MHAKLIGESVSPPDRASGYPEWGSRSLRYIVCGVAARCVKACAPQSGKVAPAWVRRVRICSSTPFVPRPTATSWPSAPAMKCVGQAVAP